MLRIVMTSLVMSGALFLSACGGNSEEHVESSNPPTELTYQTPIAIYMVGQQIVPNLPAHSGDPIQSYKIDPALPPGLHLDPSTGVITGIPAQPQAETVFTVTGAATSGSTSTQIRITVVAS